MPYAIALDLGGTQTRAALVDENGNVSNRVSLPTPAQDGGEAVVAQLAKAAEQAIANLEKVDPTSEDLPQFKEKLAALKK